MNKSVRAALKILGLTQMPKTQIELKSIYRKYAKITHPDGGELDVRQIQRVCRAYEILRKAIDQEKTPKVFVKFGTGQVQKAKVEKSLGFEYTQSTYLVTLHWFHGMLIQIDSGGWQEIKTSESFIEDDICFVFV